VALRPFKVAKESAAHAWTAEDARSPEAIRELAHNELEERRLLEENARITGRQLVYRKADIAPSGLSGTFTGRLPGLEQSLVTLAFKQGTEAFTIVSPEDGVFFQGHPREPGEIILSSFLPDAYLALPGGEPIRTNEQFKPAE
jgi:hypothetical protein